jgi:fucose permease
MRTAPRLLTFLCYAAMMCLAIGLNLVPVFLTTISVTYGGAHGLTQEQLGRLGASSVAGLVVGILVTGPLADRLGAKRFAQGGNALIAIGLIAAGFTTDYAMLGVSLFVLGVGAGVLDMILSPVVAALNPSRRAAAMNWLHSFYCVGAAVTILAGTLALLAGIGWRNACLILFPVPAALCVVFGLLAFPRLAPEGRRTPMRQLVGHRWFLWALVAIFLGGGTELSLAQWLPAYAERSLHFPAWVGGGALLLFSVAMALGRMVIAAAGTRLNPFKVMAWGGGLSCVLFLFGSLGSSPPWALAACIAAGFTGSSLWPTMLAVTADRYPDGGASMYGLLAAFGNAGGICLPWAVGWIADQSDLHRALAISAIVPALMVFVVARLKQGRAELKVDS